MQFESLEPRRLLSANVIDVSVIYANNSVTNSGEAIAPSGPLPAFSGGVPMDAAVGPNGTLDVAETINNNFGVMIGSLTAVADLGGIEKVHNVTPLENGKVVLTGESSGVLVAARFNQDATLDTTFASGGKLITNFSAVPGSLMSVFSDGSIVIFGFINGVQTAGRYDATGIFDSTFRQHDDDVAVAASLTDSQTGEMLAHFAEIGSPMGRSISASGDATVVEGQTYTLDLSASGLGTQSVDNWIIDWGDSPWPQTWPGNSITSPTHQYVNVRSATIHVTAQLDSLKLVADGTPLDLPSLGIVTTPSLDIASDAKLDLKDNALIVTDDSRTAVEALVAAGYQNNWTGLGGIASSNAQGDSNGRHEIGIASADDSGNETFCDQPVSASDVLVKYTWAGDANLSGYTDYDDFNLFYEGWHHLAAARWYNGDFNYDGLVTFDDFNKLQAGYVHSPVIEQTGEAQWLDTLTAADVHIDRVVPRPPSNLAVAWDDSSDGYLLTWDTSDQIPIGYTIEMTNQADSSVVILTAGEGQGSLPIDIDQSTDYTFRVRAEATDGESSDWSDAFNFNSDDETPTDPTDVQAFQSESDGLVVTWHDAAHNETGYEVLVKSDGPNDDWEVWGTYGANTVMGSAHMPTGHHYDVQVIAIGAHDNSDSTATSMYMHPALVYDFKADHYETITGITASWSGDIGAEQTGGSLTLSLGELPAHYALQIFVGCIGDASEGGTITVNGAGSTMQLADNQNGTLGQVMDAPHTGGDATVTITGSGWSGDRTWKLDVVTVRLLRYTVLVNSETAVVGDADGTLVHGTIYDAYANPVAGLQPTVEFDPLVMQLDADPTPTDASGVFTFLELALKPRVTPATVIFNGGDENAAPQIGNDWKITGDTVAFASQGVKHDMVPPPPYVGEQQPYGGTQWEDLLPYDNQPDKHDDAAYTFGYPISIHRSTPTAESHVSATVNIIFRSMSFPPGEYQLIGDVSGPGDGQFKGRLSIIPDPNTASFKYFGSAQVTCDRPLPLTIANELYYVHWKVERYKAYDAQTHVFTGPQSTKDVGASKNWIYVTGASTTTQFQTVLEVGCKGGSGKAPDDSAGKNAIADGVFGIFETLDVKNSTGQTLRYWGAGDQSPVESTTDSLMKYTDGRCGAWTAFLRDVLLAQGLTDLHIVEVRPNWPMPAPDPKPEWGQTYQYSVQQLNIELPAQGNGSPRKTFDNHAILLWKDYESPVVANRLNRAFDPSYGQQAQSTGGGMWDVAFTSWEDKALSKMVYLYNQPGEPNPDAHPKLNDDVAQHVNQKDCTYIIYP